MKFWLAWWVFAGAWLSSLAGAQQPVRERVSVGVIRVSLTARTSSGKPVRDLTLEQLSVRVDGQPVLLDSLTSTAQAPQVATTVTTTAPAALESTPPPTAQDSVTSIEPIHLAVLLDDRGTNSLDRRDVYRQLKRFLDRSAAGERQVMVTRSIGKTLEVLCPWTRDPACPATALDNLAAHAASPRVISPHEISGLSEGDRLSLSTQVLFERERLFRAVLVAIAAFPSTPARRLLVVVTSGTALLSPPDFAELLSSGASSLPDSDRNTSRGPREEAAREIEQAHTAFQLWSNTVRRDWYGQVADVMAKAQEKNVALVSVNAEAVDRDTNPSAEKKWGVRAMPGVTRDRLPASSGLSARLPVGQTMATLALQTGGEAILTPLQVESRLREVQANEPYLLTFRDPFPDDHRHHRIEIMTTRQGVVLQYRRGYRTPTEEEEVLDGLMVRLVGPAPVVNPLSATVAITSNMPPGEAPMLHITARYEPPQERGVETRQERSVGILVAAQDEDGNRSDPAKWEGTGHRIGTTTAFAFDFDLKIPPKAYKWSVAIRDTPTGLVSYVVTESRF